MSARERSPIGLFLRGSEVWRHHLSMLSVGVGLVGLVSMTVGVLVMMLTIKLITTDAQEGILIYNRVAAAQCWLGLGNVGLLARDFHADGTDSVTLLPSQILTVTSDAYAGWLRIKAWIGMMVGALAAIMMAVVTVRYYHRFGLEKSSERHLRGARLVSAVELRDEVLTSREGPGRYTFAGVPIPKGMEMRNILCTGGMGSGKSVAIFDLADQVFAKGRKAVIYDKTGEFTSLYYREGIDVVLNPFDERCPGWNIFDEIEHVYEFDQIAYSLCPDQDDGDAGSRYFTGGARTVFSAALQKLWAEGRRSTNALVDVLLSQSPDALASYLEGTEASAYINPKAAEQAGGVVSTLVGAIQVLKYIQGSGFSIKRWMQTNNDSRVFITSHESVHNVLLPLISVYLDIAIRSAMGLSKTREDRLWLFLDELGSLGNIPILKISLTEARKYGVVHVVGLQNVAQLRATFGRDVTQTLRSNLQNYLVLRVSDEETQKAYSELLGAREIDEQTEGLSFGVATSRDGSNINVARKEQALVMPSEIKMLKDCEGYLQLAGPYDVARVEYTPRNRQFGVEGYIHRGGLRLSDALPVSEDEIDAGEAL